MIIHGIFVVQNITKSKILKIIYFGNVLHIVLNLHIKTLVQAVKNLVDFSTCFKYCYDCYFDICTDKA